MSNHVEDESRAAQAEALYTIFITLLIFENEMEYHDSSSDSDSSSSAVDDPPDSDIIFGILAGLYSQRNWKATIPIRKTNTFMDFLLGEYKNNRPDVFRKYLRISPQCFDDLVAILSLHPVFQNNSNYPQADPARQIAVALYRFGHFGNSASKTEVALKFGISYGSVLNYTNRVLEAIVSPSFSSGALQWASLQDKAEAKDWVESVTCAAWRNGWLMVDGSLVPLYQRPAHFGNNFYDRKSNYSTAIQIISLPDRRIIDFSVGRTGSTQDSVGWTDTWFYPRHEHLLGPGEWIWADSAYPLRKWCQSPYISPEKDLPDNHKHNYYLSCVRVRSEHTISLLKGRWCSLKGMRVAINSQEGFEFAALWIRATILLHSFAMKHERADSGSITPDDFFELGTQYRREMDRFEREWERTRRDAAGGNAEAEEGLREGKLMRKALKASLLTALAER